MLLTPSYFFKFPTPHNPVRTSFLWSLQRGLEGFKMLEGMVRSPNSRKTPFGGAARRFLRFGALRGMRSIEIDPEVFRRELSAKHGLWVPSLARLREVPVEHLDVVAAKLIRDAERLALVEGAGLGLGGIITFLPDASFLTIITLRLIQRLALLYGFETREADQRLEMWKAAAAATVVFARQAAASPHGPVPPVIAVDRADPAPQEIVVVRVAPARSSTL